MGKKVKSAPSPTLTQAILESISDGVFTVDGDWKVTSFNRAAEEITGIPKEEALGKFCWEVFRSSHCEGACFLRSTLETGQPIINRPCFIVTAEGERIPISVSTAVLRDEKGRVAGGAETFRDLSEVEALRKELEGRFQMGDMVSHSPAMETVFELGQAVAESSSTVLIQGETGVGKEVLARAIHADGPRHAQPFLAVNCGALPESLLESELFGYRKGAFTGAVQDRAGRFERAGRGTLFLDEIGEISQTLQVKLLRVLQEQEYEPLGSEKSLKSEARILCATNRDLSREVREGRFREDLFYRINVVRIEIPPLRRRQEDIPLLVQHFIEKFNHLQGRNIEGVSPEVLTLLMAYEWPGNVRQLENVVERAFVLCRGNWLEVEQLPEEIRGGTGGDSQSGQAIEAVRQAVEKQAIEKSLKRNGYNRLATARELGIHKTTLYRKMKKWGIEGQRK